jgi:hypothetical protein
MREIYMFLSWWPPRSDDRNSKGNASHTHLDAHLNAMPTSSSNSLIPITASNGAMTDGSQQQVQHNNCNGLPTSSHSAILHREPPTAHDGSKTVVQQDSRGHHRSCGSSSVGPSVSPQPGFISIVDGVAANFSCDAHTHHGANHGMDGDLETSQISQKSVPQQHFSSQPSSRCATPSGIQLRLD